MDPDPPEDARPGFYRAALDTRFIAIGELLERHRKALSAFARKRLFRNGIPAAEYSNEDVVQSSFRTFLEELVGGRIAYIPDDDGTLRIVRQIIADKVSARRAQMRSLKRNPFRIRRVVGKILRIASVRDGIVDDELIPFADDVNLLRTGVPSEEVKLIAQEFAEKLLDTLAAELD